MRQYSFHLALLLLSETFLLSSLYLYFSFPYDFSSLISFFLFQSSFFTLWRGWIPSGSTRALSLRSDLRTSASATSASWLKDEFVFLVAVISSLSFVNSVSSIFFEPLTSDPADLPSSFESDPDYHSTETETSYSASFSYAANSDSVSSPTRLLILCFVCLSFINSFRLRLCCSLFSLFQLCLFLSDLPIDSWAM